jgi:acyl dehydratase
MTTRNDVWPGGMPQVGQKARRTREVLARDIELFTEISGDRNPLHYDEATARATNPAVSSCRAASPVPS